MNREPMKDGEVRSRLLAIEDYNTYFRRELDAQGLPLTQHIVGQRKLWRIMTREWGVDPTKFGIERPGLEWNPNKQDDQQPAEDLSDGF